MSKDSTPSQLATFKKAARELECDESGKAFNAALEKLGNVAERCFLDEEKPSVRKAPKKPKAK